MLRPVLTWRMLRSSAPLRRPMLCPVRVSNIMLGRVRTPRATRASSPRGSPLSCPPTPAARPSWYCPPTRTTLVPLVVCHPRAVAFGPVLGVPQPPADLLEHAP
eukprot:2886139-Rhodomonas_salina.1